MPMDKGIPIGQERGGWTRRRELLDRDLGRNTREVDGCDREDLPQLAGFRQEL